VFTLDAYECFWHQLEPQWNPKGWGYDLCLFDYCQQIRNMTHFTMGVVQRMRAIHHKEYGRVEYNGSLTGPISAMVSSFVTECVVFPFIILIDSQVEYLKFVVNCVEFADYIFRGGGCGGCFFAATRQAERFVV
jgi:hypothetical protein